RFADFVSDDNLPPLTQTGMAPVMDVEDISMANLRLDNGVFLTYQQCHFTPDYWRNYTVIGTKGRIENFGDGPGETIKVWTSRTSGFAEPDETVEILDGEGGHGGADPLLIEEFLRFAAEGGQTQTSPVAARQAVVAGILAAESLRGDGSAKEVPALPEALVEYFDAGQPALVRGA
ncbi:MAG: Gfo/Idh/MocA family oxidoreductase, partial [Gemmatimonadales bacterium]